MTRNQQQRAVRGEFNDRRLAGRETGRTGVGVIGCGEWGPNHIRTFQANSQAFWWPLWIVNSSRLERIRALYPAVECHTNRGNVFNDDRVNAVVIATPPPTHFAIAREALLAGKHVLCEKPLCETSAQAKELILLAKRKKLGRWWGHVSLQPWNCLIRRAGNKGDLGQMYYILAVRTNLGCQSAKIAMQLSILQPTISPSLTGS